MNEVCKAPYSPSSSANCPNHLFPMSAALFFMILRPQSYVIATILMTLGRARVPALIVLERRKWVVVRKH